MVEITQYQCFSSEEIRRLIHSINSSTSLLAGSSKLFENGLYSQKEFLNIVSSSIIELNKESKKLQKIYKLLTKRSEWNG